MTLKQGIQVQDWRECQAEYLFHQKWLRFIERVLGEAGLAAVRKFFGVILLAIAVKIFGSNISGFGK